MSVQNIILRNNCWFLRNRYAAEIGFIWKVEKVLHTFSTGLMGAI